MELLQRCVACSFQWMLFDATEVMQRLYWLPDSHPVLALVFLYCACESRLPFTKIDDLTALVRSHVGTDAFLCPVLETAGVNHDIDGLTIQVSFLLSPSALTVDMPA